MSKQERFSTDQVGDSELPGFLSLFLVAAASLALIIAARSGLTLKDVLKFLGH